MTLQAKAAAALGALLCAASAQAAIVVSFTPASQHVNVGDTVVVDISISGLGAEILSGIDMNVVWGAAVANWMSFDADGSFNQLGNNIGIAPDLDFDTTANGNLGMQLYAVADNATLAAGQADAFLLARLTLSATADGVTRFTLGSDLDYDRNFVGLDPLTSLDVTVGSACVAVGTGSCNVPEPASYGLAALALLGAAAPGLWRRRGQRGA